jgi:hypothetical protein
VFDSSSWFFKTLVASVTALATRAVRSPPAAVLGVVALAASAVGIRPEAASVRIWAAILRSADASMPAASMAVAWVSSAAAWGSTSLRILAAAWAIDSTEAVSASILVIRSVNGFTASASIGVNRAFSSSAVMFKSSFSADAASEVVV